MSFNQNLLHELQCEESFATTWLANNGKELKKFCEKHDVNQINVADICNKITSKFNSTLQRKKTKRQESLSMMKNSFCNDENEEKCVLPFRVISKLCLGAVHIFQKQVDHLLDLTTHLLEASKVEIFKVPKIPTFISRKQKSTQRKRIKIIKTTKNNIQTTNEYSSNFLLDNDNYELQCGECDDLLINTEKQDIQKTEVTIQEINAKIIKVNYKVGYYDINCSHENDDIDNNNNDVDDDFGNATEEELVQFFNFCQDQNESCSYVKTLFTKNSTKRKSNDHVEDICLPTKQLCIKNEMNNEHGIDNNRSYLLNEIQVHQGNSERKQEQLITSTIFSKQNCNESLNYNSNVMIKEEEVEEEDEGQPEQILEVQNCFRDASSNIINGKQQQQQKQLEGSTKLIVDACTTIAKQVIDENIKKFEAKWSPRTRKPLRIQFKKKLHQKKISSSAIDLLSKLNKRILKMKLNFNKQFTFTQQQFQDSFLMLISGIFLSNNSEAYAKEIYPNWFNYYNMNQHKITEHLLWPLNPSRNLNNNNNLNIDNTEEMLNNYYNNDKNHYEEYQPHSIMTKLLHIWQQNASNEIDANKFCNAASTNVERALTFASMLVLNAMNLIVITNMKNTSYMDKIMLGNKTRKLICSYIWNSNT